MQITTLNVDPSIQEQLAKQMITLIPHEERQGFAKLSTDAVLANIDRSGLGIRLPSVVRKSGYLGAIVGITARERSVCDASEEEAAFLSSGGDRLLSSATSARVIIEILHAITRKKRAVAQSEATVNGSEPAVLVRLSGRMRLDVERMEVLLDGKSVRLTKSEFAILLALARRPGVFMDCGTLLHVLGLAGGEDLVVRSHLKRMRAKLSKERRSIIETRYGIGYRMIP